MRSDSLNLGESLSATESLTVVVLTYNEGKHIARCIRSVLQFANEILVVDAGSSDDTVEQARALGARVLRNPWINHATQLNWALSYGEIRTEWVMRLDADEFVDEMLTRSILEAVKTASTGIGGFEINRRIRFMGREIKYGGMAPLWVTRLWRTGWACCELRWMDEHMVMIRGSVARLSGVIIDENLNSLTWWTQKHNAYASREAVDLLVAKYRLELGHSEKGALNWQAAIKRLLKKQVYSRLPLGCRAWLYFSYRVFLRLGFLDGSRGMLFHTLQGLWYRLLVDAKVAEVEDSALQRGCDIPTAIRDVLGIDLSPPGHTHNVRSP